MSKDDLLTIGYILLGIGAVLAIPIIGFFLALLAVIYVIKDINKEDKPP